MATIAENLQILVDNKADIKEAIERVIAEDNITLRMSAWADLLNAYEDELQAKSSTTAFPFRFPITFKPEQTISKYFPFSLPLTFTPPPMKAVYNVTDISMGLPIINRYYGTPLGVFAAIIIDGENIPSSAMPRVGNIYSYTNITTTGLHAIEYELKDKTTIPSNAFRGIRNESYYTLQSVTIPSNVTSIGEYAFSGIRITETVVVPKGVTKIAKGCFYYSGTIELLGEVTSIESVSFREGTNLILHTIVPPTVVSGHQGSFISFLGYVYVPSEAVNTYKTATGWTTVASRIKPIPEQ